MGAARLLGREELASEEFALGRRKLPPRFIRMRDMTARVALGLISLCLGAAGALGLVQGGLFSPRAARGPAASGFGFNSRRPRMLIMLLGFARRLLAREGGLWLRWHFPPAVGADVLTFLKRFGRRSPATTFSGLTSLVLDG